MFGGTLWGGNIGGAEDHSTREREPPARPTSLEFPAYVPPFSPKHLNAASSSAVRDKICHIRSFTEISDDDLSLLNLKFEHDVEVSKLLPEDNFQDRPYLFDDDLDALLTEISVDNQDAFREILRMEPQPGRTKPRLAYARNFFGSLEDMARYWDSSADEYYSIPVDKIGKQESSTSVARMVNGLTSVTGTKTSDQAIDLETTRTESATAFKDDGARPKTKQVYKGYRFGNGEQLNPGSRVAMVKNLLKMVTHKFACRDHEPMPAPREKFVLRGVRIQSIQYHFCVARIPKDSKLARARMVEGPLIAVHCREEIRFRTNPRMPNLGAVLAGSANLEGTATPIPLKPVNARITAPTPGFVGERFDLFREVSCMLILARQRAREGIDKASYSGADKWWVTEKRWGNGPLKWGQLASEVYEDEDPSWGLEEKQLQEDKRLKEVEERARSKDSIQSVSATAISIDDLMAKNAPDLPSLPGDPLGGPRKKKLRSLDRPPGKEEELKDGRKLMYVPPFRKKWYQDWQRLKPNMPMWDDKIIYKHIGKREESQFDDIYMVTSVNHHVALLRMKVHPDYLSWIDSGSETPEKQGESELSNHVLYVQRSSWFNMFDVEERQQFLIVLWRLMCWLNRNYIDKAEYAKMEEERKARQ